MITLAEIINTLSRPDAYSQATRSVTIAQTQMSVVFLTDDLVYKIKKPVNKPEIKAIFFLLVKIILGNLKEKTLMIFFWLGYFSDHLISRSDK